MPAAVFSIYDSNHNKIASIESPKTAHFGVTRKRAEFIVTACNTHKELIEMCKKALALIRYHGFIEGTLYDDLKNALAKAEEK